MTCTELGAEVLMDHLLGDVDESTRARIDAHAATCPECRQGLETLSRLNEVVWATQEFQDIKVPPDVHAQILERCREALETVKAMREVGSRAPSVTERLAARRASRRGFRVRRLIPLAVGVAGVVLFLVLANLLFTSRRSEVGTIEAVSGRVEFLAPDQRDGVAVGAGVTLREGDRLRTARQKAAARVRLKGGAVIHVGGLSTVRFMGSDSAEVLRGRAFVEVNGRGILVKARDLDVSGSTARFDLRILEPGETARADIGGVRLVSDGAPPAAPADKEILLTVVAGSVEYGVGVTYDTLDTGWQLRKVGPHITRRQVQTEPFWSWCMTDAECDALPTAMLNRLIAHPVTRLEAGRIQLAYSFDTDEQMNDWRLPVGDGTWRRDEAALRGTAASGARTVIYHVARFQGDLEVRYDVSVDASAPGSQSFWRVFADPTSWERSGFSGWTAVERVEDEKPVRTLSLFFLDRTRASAPAADLRALDYRVAVEAGGGNLSFRVAQQAPLTCAIGDAPDNGHVGLGVAGGDIRFRNVTIIGRLQPDWVRYALEELSKQDLAGD